MEKNLNKKEEIIWSLEQIMTQVDNLHKTGLLNLDVEISNIYDQLAVIIENIDDHSITNAWIKPENTCKRFPKGV